MLSRPSPSPEKQETSQSDSYFTSAPQVSLLNLTFGCWLPPKYEILTAIFHKFTS
jgi:hypothetical protein